MSIPAPVGIRAVFVTWNPDPGRLYDAVQSVAEQVDGVIVVDNGSDNRATLVDHYAASDQVTVVPLADNLGIGAALNVGVRLALLEDPTWIVTMDQDTLVSAGAVRGILHDYAALDEHLVRNCGILALRPHPQPASIWLTRYAESLLVLRDCGAFTERRGVITSGNLIRSDVARHIRFNESLFIDQVDFDFCSSLRRHHYIVLQQRAITTDHLLGERYDGVVKDHPYENAQRFYYIVRNSTYLVLRGRLVVRYYAAQIVVIAGAFVSVNGVGSLLLGVGIIARAVLDAVLGRMGRREYQFLRRGRR
ncbi:MAG: glycosyltransferase [Actinomycetota bacterium]|jgi:rhamnosyltransferase|nr:glycosyltransferase [Actinomycetota bacterium]